MPKDLTIYLNDEPVKDYNLGKYEKHEIELELKPGKNVVRFLMDDIGMYMSVRFKNEFYNQASGSFAAFEKSPPGKWRSVHVQFRISETGKELLFESRLNILCFQSNERDEFNDFRERGDIFR